MLNTIREPQRNLLFDPSRFVVAMCGRRSGKTQIAKIKLASESLKDPGLYFASAPTYGQAKKIYWQDIKSIMADMTDRVYESDLILKLKPEIGSEIHVIGLDKPARIEGTPWTGGIVDEFADVKPQAWYENIRPALSTYGLNTWCWLIGVPDGLNHAYEIAEYAKQAEGWNFHSWPSSIILSPSELEEAKRTLDPRTFKQEYEASFETATGRIYDDYSADNHTDCVFSADRAIHWTHDFNFVPMSSVIIQERDGRDYCVDEISLESASARNVAIEFVERYKGNERLPIFLYGDPSGKAGEKHGLLSNYLELERYLKDRGFHNVQRRVLRSERSIRDSQAALRGRILNAAGERNFYVNPFKCPTLNKGLMTTQRAKGSAYQEDPSNIHHHITTAARFYAQYQYPVHGKPEIRIR